MRKNEEKTPSEKARKATLGAIARLGACAYLAYIIYTLIKMSIAGDAGMPLPVVIATTVVLGIAALILIIITVRSAIIGAKNRDYSMHKYYQEELDAQGLVQNEFGEYVPAETLAAEIVPDDDSDDAEEDSSDEGEAEELSDEPEEDETDTDEE